MKQLTKQFNKEYNFLYENRDQVAGYGEALGMFDELVKTKLEVIREFCQYRGDILGSDREQAAFVFALHELGRL